MNVTPVKQIDGQTDGHHTLAILSHCYRPAWSGKIEVDAYASVWWTEVDLSQYRDAVAQCNQLYGAAARADSAGERWRKQTLRWRHKLHHRLRHRAACHSRRRSARTRSSSRSPRMHLNTRFILQTFIQLARQALVVRSLCARRASLWSLFFC